MILLDTHVLIWAWRDHKEIGLRTRKVIDQAWSSDALVAVSSTVFWEISMLVQRNRLKIDRNLKVWRLDQLASGLTEIEVNGEIGILANELDWDQRDPVDRLIVATALTYDLTLVSADEKMLAWKGIAKTVDART